MKGDMQSWKQLYNSAALWYDFSNIILNIIYCFYLEINRKLILDTKTS